MKSPSKTNKAQSQATSSASSSTTASPVSETEERSGYSEAASTSERETSFRRLRDQFENSSDATHAETGAAVNRRKVLRKTGKGNRRAGRLAGLGPENQGLDNSGRFRPSVQAQEFEGFITEPATESPVVRNLDIELDVEEIVNMSSVQEMAAAIEEKVKGLTTGLTRVIDQADEAAEAKKGSFKIVRFIATIKAKHEDIIRKANEMDRLGNEDLGIDLVTFYEKVEETKEEVQRVIDSLQHYVNVTDGVKVQPVENGQEGFTQAAKIGKLDLPDFYGDSLDFEHFESTFKTLINTCRYNQGSKAAMLKQHLKGPAADFLGKEGHKHMTYDEIWEGLRKKYGVPWLQTRDAVSQMFDIEAPSEDHNDIEKYINKRRDALRALKRLEINLEQAIVNDTLNNLPESVRDKLDDKLQPIYDDYKMTFEQFADQANRILKTGDRRSLRTSRTVKYNAGVQANYSNGNRHEAKSNRYDNRAQQQKIGEKPKYKNQPKQCSLCDTKPSEHSTSWCKNYKAGPESRQRLEHLGRCRACGVKKTYHGENCIVNKYMHCRYHPNEQHWQYTCDGSEHPGGQWTAKK